MFTRSGQGPESAYVVFTAPVNGTYMVEVDFTIVALHDSVSASYSRNGGSTQGPFTAGTSRSVQLPVSLAQGATYTMAVTTDNPLPGVEPEWEYKVSVRLVGGPDLA